MNDGAFDCAAGDGDDFAGSGVGDLHDKAGVADLLISGADVFEPGVVLFVVVDDVVQYERI